MRITRLIQFIVVCLFISFIFSPVFAYWDNPVFLSELNDYQNHYAATNPVVSSDESIILFSRHYPGYNYSLWEAKQNSDTGLYEQQRRLTELKNNGANLFGCWLSEDKLRLYYAAPDPSNLGWSLRPIWMATRNTVDDTWHTVKRHNELEIEALQVNCSLTTDEKLIMYESVDQAGTTVRRIFTASRDSINSSFSNLQEHYELEALGAAIPQMSRDGLTVYFKVVNDSGYTEAWEGTRNSLDEPFSNFSPLEDINTLTETYTGTPFPSWDGQKLFFFQMQDETGIFVVHWVDPPEVVVDLNLSDAIAQKQQIIEDLQATIAMEIDTLEILRTLQSMTHKGSNAFHAIQKTEIQIRKSLQDEILAQIKIRNSIHELEKALSYYRMEEPTHDKHPAKREIVRKHKYR